MKETFNENIYKVHRHLLILLGVQYNDGHFFTQFNHLEYHSFIKQKNNFDTQVNLVNFQIPDEVNINCKFR